MSERWERVGILFDQALTAPPGQRAQIIDSAADPADIKEEVRALIAAHETAGDFLERPPTADLAPGTQIGAYRIGGVLGRGGMGVVYEAEDTRLRRRVALKCVSPEFSTHPGQQERLQKEARAAAALQHPGIATVYALEEIDDQLFISAEYVEGETLRAELDRGPLELPRALTTILEIARALCAAHERGIVHRDLKPENIMRTTSGGVKILDFGLAHFDDAAHDLASRTRMTQDGTVAGTPPYMAPEQLLGKQTDSRVDQFALGILLYELSTGRHPFSSKSLPSTIAHILASAPQPPPDHRALPPDLWQIVERSLEKDPANRFPSTRELVSALEAAGDSLASRAPAPPTTAYGAPLSLEPSRTVPPASALTWWRFHQFAAALAYWSMVWPAWHVHGALGRTGLFFFFATLAAVVVAGNLRLHLWFSSRVYPEDLPEQRADVSVWIRSADIAFSLILVIGGIALPEPHAGWAALLISFGIGAAIAFLFIEPATARAAFRTVDRARGVSPP